jgi:hypothetical protein
VEETDLNLHERNITIIHRMNNDIHRSNQREVHQVRHLVDSGCVPQLETTHLPEHLFVFVKEYDILVAICSLHKLLT